MSQIRIHRAKAHTYKYVLKEYVCISSLKETSRHKECFAFVERNE